MAACCFCYGWCCGVLVLVLGALGAGLAQVALRSRETIPSRGGARGALLAPVVSDGEKAGERSRAVMLKKTKRQK